MLNIKSIRSFSILQRKRAAHLGQSLEGHKRNIQFPLNLGYNDHYKFLVNSHLPLKDKIKLLFMRRSYNNVFKNKYKSLLQAIYDTKYYQLEQILEPGLLNKLASDVYQLVKIEK
jgi:hypothetical protein